MRLFLVPGAAIAFCLASPASAQTADEAAGFIDQVFRSPVVINFDEKREMKPVTSRTSACVTKMRDVSTDPEGFWRIDWTNVTDLSPSVAPGSDTVIVIGGGYAIREAVAKMRVRAGTPAMRDRLLRAMQFYRNSCAPPKGAF